MFPQIRKKTRKECKEIISFSDKNIRVVNTIKSTFD